MQRVGGVSKRGSECFVFTSLLEEPFISIVSEPVICSSDKELKIQNKLQNKIKFD